MSKKKNKKIDNSLTEIVMGDYSPFNYGTPLSQVDSLFNNVKTYLISNMRQILSQFYIEHGLCQTIINVPVDDALRGGIDIKTEQLSEDEIRQIKCKMDSQGDVRKAGQALKWCRLYGGGGVVIMTGQKHDEPLDLKKLDNMEFRAVDMWELYSGQQNIHDDTRGLILEVDKKDFCFNYYSINLHNSRVIVIKGLEAPAFIRPRLRGWGVSTMEYLIQSINQFLKLKNLTYEVLDEFKLDIFRIKGFNQAILSRDGTEKIQRRVALANQQKNFQNALTMDIEDEHQSKQLNFSGLSEVQKDVRIQIATDMRMPLTKLFGVSAAGFNSGEDDIEVYNGMIESEIRPRAKEVLLEMVKLRCQELFGMIPSDLEIEFKPLRILSHEQEENVKEKKFNRVVMALEKGLCSVKEAKEAMNRGNLLDVKVEIESVDETEQIRAQDDYEKKSVADNESK